MRLSLAEGFFAALRMSDHICDGVLVPGEPRDPASPVKDDGDDIDACVFRQFLSLGLVMLPVYLDEAGEAGGLGRSDGLLRRADVGRGAAAHFHGHQCLVDDTDDIKLPGAVADVLRQGLKTLGFKASAG